MTSAESLIFYPAYCFHLSPTINKWCPLRAADIHGLEGRPGFEGDNVFFSLNHPIRWVRIVGVVVGIDEYYGHRNYTVDDSTGACIECSIDIPKPADSRYRNGAEDPAPDPYSEIDIGMVVEVKGSTKVFREQKQIKVQKLQRVGSTNQEVQFWNKIRNFREDVLSKPWVLEKKEVRRCKKQYMADVDSKERKKKTRKGNGLAIDKHKRDPGLGNKNGEVCKSAKEESPAMLGAQRPYAKDQYSALGL
ncbi:hypothetical protein F4814DRAFT_420855 [Daldinia grandis]|nr:hypothetical protein F4814DRAFT_420855 [Daldinia grandis]